MVLIFHIPLHTKHCFVIRMVHYEVASCISRLIIMLSVGLVFGLIKTWLCFDKISSCAWWFLMIILDSILRRSFVTVDCLRFYNQFDASPFYVSKYIKHTSLICMPPHFYPFFF